MKIPQVCLFCLLSRSFRVLHALFSWVLGISSASSATCLEASHRGRSPSLLQTRLYCTLDPEKEDYYWNILLLKWTLLHGLFHSRSWQFTIACLLIVLSNTSWDVLEWFPDEQNVQQLYVFAEMQIHIPCSFFILLPLYMVLSPLLGIASSKDF